MMPADKESWNEFAGFMQEAGYESLAIDLRGHGESDGGPRGYQNFSDEQHRQGILDLLAGWKFLESRRAVPEKTVLVGASIGANLSLQFAAENPEFKKIVLLSPGFNYRGIDAKELMSKLSEDQGVLLATSRDDGNNADQNNALYDLIKSKNKKMLVYLQSGHGTDILKTEERPNLAEAIKNFIES
jgi:esterase/lipase